MNRSLAEVQILNEEIIETIVIGGDASTSVDHR